MGLFLHLLPSGFVNRLVFLAERAKLPIEKHSLGSATEKAAAATGGAARLRSKVSMYTVLFIVIWVALLYAGIRWILRNERRGTGCG